MSKIEEVVDKALAFVEKLITKEEEELEEENNDKN